MHFIIPVIVFVTANIWGYFSRIPFTNIDRDHSWWDRAIGGVQLASTVYTLDQIPHLLDQEAIAHHLIKEYLGGWNATVVSNAESVLTLGAGHRPSTAPSTIPPSFLHPSSSPSTNKSTGPPPRPRADMPQRPPVDELAHVLLSVIFAMVVWIIVKQNDLTRRLIILTDDLGTMQRSQETVWNGIVQSHADLAILATIAQEMRMPVKQAAVVVEEVEEPHKQFPDSEGSASSSDASSAAVTHTLQDVMTSLDTLRQTIDRSTDVWEGLSERLVLFQAGSQDTQPTESSGDDQNGALEEGLVQDR